MEKLLKLLGRLEIALALAIVLPGAQLAWPALDTWFNRPRPGRQVAQRGDDAYSYLVIYPKSRILLRRD